MANKFQLKNGLKVLLVESHRAPVVSVQMWVRTGSADERKGEEGLSHFIEHLLFKGTRKYKTGEIAALIEGSGGELNAYTSFDQTVFYITISKHYADTALDVINEMMGHPLFDPMEIDNEREVVIEEIRQGRDSLSRIANQKMFSTVYKKHPYGIPVIGYEKIVKNISVNKIKKYFADRYSAKNMFLVIAGDFDGKVMKKKVEAVFSDLPAGKVRKVKRKKEPQQAKARLVSENYSFVQAVGALTWRGPSVHHRDVPALDVLAGILGQGDSSRLVIKTRIQRPLVNGISTYCYTPMDPGLLSISFNFEIGNEAEILDSVLQEIERILNQPPSNEEMQKVLTGIASEQIYGMETVEGIARNKGSFEFYFQNPEYFKKYLQILYSLQPRDIVRVAKKYFNPKTLNISFLSKEGKLVLEKQGKEFLKKFNKIYLKSAESKLHSREKLIKYAKLNSPKISARKQTEPEKIELPSGIKVLFKSEPDTPTLSVRTAFLGGLRAEDEARGGVAELVGRCLTGGGVQFSEEEINHRIDSMAASLTAFSGRNSFGLNMEFLSPYRNEMFEIYRDILSGPAWADQVCSREKEILVNQIRSQNDKPASLCGKQFLGAMFKGHPYSRDMLGSEESLATASSVHLRTYFQKLGVARNMTVAVVGDIHREELLELLGVASSQLAGGSQYKANFPLPKIDQDVHLFRELKKEQTHIMVGYRGVRLDDPDRNIVHIINAILSGQGGRLFLELRDKNSLAYSVYPTHMEGIEGGYFGGYISCAPDKAKTSIAMLKSEFEKMASTKVSPGELDRAKRYLIGGHDIEMQRKSSIGSGMLFDDIYGLDFRSSFKVDSIYESISAADVQRVAQKIFSGKSVVSVVGSNDGTNGPD